MSKDHAAEFREDLKEFHEMTKKFYQKELNVAQYKKFSGGFGSYAQRGGSASMLRLRFAGGEIPKEQLLFIAESIEKYQISLVHFSTCQSVQLHNLTEAQVCALIEESFSHGIITRGGGGDYPRNVMCSPLSGVQKGEYFHVLPYAKEAADYLLGFIHTVKLPRKLKVGFSNCAENTTHVTFRDLGFAATPKGTFDVYSAGGLGRNPKMGVLVASDINPSNILYYIKAMVDTFTAYGDYENRGKSRTRFLQDTLGTEGYRKAYLEKLSQVLESEEDLTIQTVIPEITKQGDGQTVKHPRVLSQKQDGLYTVFYHPIGGSPKPEFFRRLYDMILPMEEAVLRVSPDESLYILNLTSQEAEQVLALTEDGAQTLFETSVSCIGASICQIGARDSQSLLRACIDRVRQENLPDYVLPKIHISGCPSSCSGHQIAALGFRGGVKQTPEGPKPAFAVFELGCPYQGEESFATELGVMLESDIPEFLAVLGKEIASRKMTYETFIKKHHDDFLTIAGDYL
ncbi:MAG: nitrite/sulfite reductase [Lachnospiraceae bacterium]|nr:nitrite/sulfite reductase [Lachnospiraceae bacterium]